MKAKDFLGRVILILGIVMVALLVMAVRVMAQTGSGDPGGVPPVQVTPEALALFAGGALSLFFSYVPKLNTKFAALATESKRLIMLGLLAATAVVIYGLGCGGIVQTGIACSQQGLTRLVYIFVLAMISNQSTFTITPQTSAVKAVKAG